MPLAAPVPLAEHHDLDSFICSEQSLNDWLRKQARRNAASGASNVFVCCDGNRVLGYYSTSASSVLHADVPKKLTRNMPQPIPVVLLGRLAVDLSMAGQGMGRSLFRDAAQRVNQAADQIGVVAMIVHPISDAAQAFWLKQGFIDCPGEQRMMIATLKDIRAVIGQPTSGILR